MAFAECNSLEFIKLPNNIRTLSSGVFQRCEKLNTIEYNGKCYTDKKEFNEQIAKDGLITSGREAWV